MPLDLCEIDSILKRALPKTDAPLISVLRGAELSKLGDAYLNFVFSLALTLRKREFCNARVTNDSLAQAMRNVGLRSLLPRRISRQQIAGAAEGLILFAAASGVITTEEIVRLLGEHENPVEGISAILRRIIIIWKT